MDELNSFYNSGKKDALYQFFMETINEEAAKKVLAREDVSGYADAKDIIDKVYQKLARLYTKKEKRDKDLNPAV